MTTRFFKRSLLMKAIAFAIIANFILTSGPIGYCPRAQAADSLRRPAAAKSGTPTTQGIAAALAETLRKERVSKAITAWFEDIRLTPEDVASVGGKNTNLGELKSFLGDMIPDGFAVTVRGFKNNLGENVVTYRGKQMTLGEYIYARTEGLDYTDQVARGTAANEIQEAIILATMPKEVEAQIRQDYDELCRKAGKKDVDVAVRSSATAEDLPEASFAGQQATFLNMRGIDAVLEATKKCWASLYEQRAMSYRHGQGIAESEAFLSVTIQLMADAEKAGVMFTLDTENGSPGIAINANYGFGESIVGGEATPDQDKLVYDAQTGKPKSWERERGNKLSKTVRTVVGTENAPTTLGERQGYCLTVEQVEELGNIGQVIEQHYKRPMDIEWVFTPGGEIKIVQARPETAWASDPLVLDMVYMQVQEEAAAGAKARALVKGPPGTPRAAGGTLRKILAKQIMYPGTNMVDKKATSDALMQELARVEKGDVLAARMTSPDYMAAMREASAIVTEQGGQTCHAAIVTRELKKPGLVGTGNALEVLEEGQFVTVDAKNGYAIAEVLPLIEVTQRNDFRGYPKVRTKVCIIVSDPDLAADLWKFSNYGSYGGIGLTRDEQFLLSRLLKHPQSVIDYDNYYDPNYKPQAWQHDKQWIKEHVIDVEGEAIRELIKDFPSFRAFYVAIKRNGLVKIAKAQAGGQSVKYRSADFKSNEYRNLRLGAEYEPDEANPMAGNRGVSRVLTPEFNEIFRLDLQALREARKLRSNIDIMFPVVRTPEDISAAVQIMAEEGLFDTKDKPRIGIMVELASNVLMVEEMYKTLAELAARYGTTAFMSIGSNDLTQFVLGADRDSEKMLKHANFWDPAVVKSIEILIKTAKRYHIETGICGEAPSKDPAFAALLVGFGIDTVSLAPDSYEAGVKAIAEAEKLSEGKPVDLTIKDWEYPSQLEVKPLPRVVAERVDASTIMSGLGVHPLAFMRAAEKKAGLEELGPNLRAEIAEILAGREIKDLIIERVSEALLAKARVAEAATPIIYTTDTNQSAQYKKLAAGEKFEADEENPYLGFGGLVRVVDPEWENFFRWQLQGVRKARESSGRNNIGIRFDLSTTTENVKRALEIMKEEGLVPGQDGLMVGMEITRGGHFVVLDQYLNLGLNFISENPELFVDYVLPEDPGSPYVNIPEDRKERMLVNGRKIWTNIATQRGVPLVQFEGETGIAVTPGVPPVATGLMLRRDIPSIPGHTVLPAGVEAAAKDAVAQMIAGQVALPPIGGPAGSPARGADRGFITAAEHEVIREVLARLDARNLKYTVQNGVLGGDGYELYRVQAVPGMMQAIKEATGGTMVRGHYAIRPDENGISYIYIDKDAFDWENGARYADHEMYELKAIREFAKNKGWALDELVKWLEETGDPAEVERVLTQIHRAAPELPAEVFEIVSDTIGSLVGASQRPVRSAASSINYPTFAKIIEKVVNNSAARHHLTALQRAELEAYLQGRRSSLEEALGIFVELEQQQGVKFDSEGARVIFEAAEASVSAEVAKIVQVAEAPELYKASQGLKISPDILGKGMLADSLIDSAKGGEAFDEFVQAVNAASPSSEGKKDSALIISTDYIRASGIKPISKIAGLGNTQLIIAGRGAERIREALGLYGVNKDNVVAAQDLPDAVFQLIGVRDWYGKVVVVTNPGEVKEISSFPIGTVFISARGVVPAEELAMAVYALYKTEAAEKALEALDTKIAEKVITPGTKQDLNKMLDDLEKGTLQFSDNTQLTEQVSGDVASAEQDEEAFMEAI